MSSIITPNKNIVTPGPGMGLPNGTPGGTVNINIMGMINDLIICRATIEEQHSIMVGILDALDRIAADVYKKEAEGETKPEALQVLAALREALESPVDVEGFVKRQEEMARKQIAVMR